MGAESRAFLLGIVTASSAWSALFAWNNVDHMRAYNDLTTRWQQLVKH